MNQESFNLRHLKAMCEVAKLRSISKASGRVHLSQPAVSQAIAKLEATLDAPLFIRSSNGVFVTEPGKLFYNRAKRALNFIRAGTKRALSGSERPRRQRATALENLVTGTQLRALLAIAQFGNFSIAARNTGVSQPSLYRAARDLERILGLVLYERTAQGFVLTDAAERLARATRLAFAELRQGLEEVNAWRGIDSTRIVIGTLPLVRTYVLPKAINDLTEIRPSARINVIDGPYSDLLHGLRHGEIDFMIGALRNPAPVDDVVQTELFRDRLSIIARSGHSLTKKRSVSVRDLSAYPWVVPRKGTPTRAHFERLFQDENLPPPEHLIESSSLILIRGLLLGSNRLTMISANQGREELRQGLLEPLPFELDHTSRPIGITVRQDWEPTATQALLIDLLRQASI